ncbi:acetyl xylan esterase [Moniliophthora roreri MCA 2997]|uniref:Carboxylic ester hydrolase n=1 Tax=Moniliophthora roreri (strain MCA 2997) TaxID=1381753 RepID=V2XYF4_MONRO|nr:acetyl xylan esterase [Moniliophthora roreri MCA 2997]
MNLKSLFSLLLGAVGAFAAAGQLQQITNFGSNPTGVQMFLYKPARLANPLPLIVAMHYCTGTAQAYFQGTQYANLADQKGFLVIYPDAPDSGGCWDVHSDATLKHDGGGDSLAIASVVRYAIQNLGVDPSLVFATGTSSGAMMTNVLMGAYPDLFKAGSAFSGVPYGCFAGPSMWQSQCAQGQLVKTAQQWGDQVRNGYPGYTGTRPKFQFWHGSTDTTLYPQNFWEEIKEWTNVFGVSQTPTQNQTGNPLPNYWRATFGSNVQAIWANGVGHTVPERADDVLAWFGLTNTTPGNGSPSNPPSNPPTTTSGGSTPPTNPPSGGTAAHWAQCGGNGWSGPTTCASPYTCTVINPYYSQCL